MAIGQGNMRVTPLQLADGFSVIANDGKLCQPRLAQDAETVGGQIVQRFPADCHQLPSYPKQWFKYVRSGLEGVPRPGGTASYAFEGFPFGQLDYFGGKTGTAQVPGKQDFSWFGAIARGKDSRGETHSYVVVALVEQGGHGSETAAPIVRQIVDGLFGLHDNSGLYIGKIAD
jgi:penicillin-binding protein 2